MTAYEILPYVIHCSICFTASIMLLTVKSYSEMGSKAFQQIKQLLATCGLIECVKAMMELGCDYYHIDTMIIMVFISPLLYYVQLAVITIGLLQLVHSRIIDRLKLRIISAPVILLTPVYIIFYLVNSSGMVSIDSFAHFNNTGGSLVFYYIWEVITLIEVVFSVYWLITETRTYRHQLVTVFSGSEVINGRKLTYLVYGFLAYFALLIIDIILMSQSFRYFFYLFNTAIFVIGAVILFNIQDSYSRVMLVEDYMKKTDVNETSLYNSDQTQNQKVNDLISAWESSSDRPYLRSGLTLPEVANDIHVDPSSLAAYLNEVCKMDFNNWIDILRVDYAMKRIEENPEFSLTDLAESAGFRNQKTMSKAFVTITGQDVETYRDGVKGNTKA